MGSRIKENPERIFEGYFEVLCPTHSDKDPELKRQFPDVFDDQDSVTTLTKFCFPFDVKRWMNSSVQHFSFTLTDLQGFQRFGFCRLSVNARSCTCILSCLPWFELFYKLLNHIAEHLVKDQFNEVTDILQSLYDHPVPEANNTLNLEMFSYFVVPDPAKLPSIPENRNLTEFLVAVQVDTMLQLYASLLCERRILITSSKLSTLTACVHASAGLLYPMYWQHIYIPTLPPHLLDYCGAPMPYLIGVHSSLMERVNIEALEDVVIFNMDSNFLETPFRDLDNLPPHVVSLLKLQLTKTSAFMGDRVSRAFLRAQALLFGTYREALIYNLEEPISFCQEAFLSHKCSSMKSFLHNAVHLQLFSQFIDSRLQKLNSDVEFTDLFEQEVTKCGLSGASRSYQLWLENLKKGGGTIINNVKNKTHPTVRNMLRYAKGQAKTGLQGMKRRIKHKDQPRIQRMGSFKADESPIQNHDRLQHRLPITQHFGQSRPRRPGKKYSEADPWECQRYDEYAANEEGESAPSDENDFPLLDEGMDLLNEIFETLNTRAPGRVRGLYGAHSLDCFNLDDSQSSEEDLRLSLSQPRHSDLWYLPEVDEGAAESLESQDDNPSTPDDIPNASHYSPLMNKASASASFMPGATSEIKEDVSGVVTSWIPDVSSPSSDVTSPSLDVSSPGPDVSRSPSPGISSPSPDICSQSPDVSRSPSPDVSRSPGPGISSPSPDVCSQSPNVSRSPSPGISSSIPNKTSPPEVISAAPQVISQMLVVPSKVKITLGTQEPEGHPTLKEETINQKTVLPLPTQKETTVRKASVETPNIIQGPCVRSAVSRFQGGTLDPRMVWTGTKKDSEQAEKVISNFRSFHTPRPVSQVYSNPKTNSPLYRVGPVFLRTQSAPKLDIPKRLILDTTIPFIQGQESPLSSLDDAEDETAFSPGSTEMKASPLPKVAQLKKKFEAD